MIRYLHQLAKENEESYPVGSNVIKTDFYVDDFISGAASIEELIETNKRRCFDSTFSRKI